MKGERANAPRLKDAPVARNGQAISILPMEIRVGDRFTDEAGEWEVVSHPVVMHTAKSLRAKVRRVGQPATEREMIWPAHVRLDIQRNTPK